MINLLFVGDIAIQGDEGLKISEEVRRVFDSSDKRVCNFEGPVGDVKSSRKINKAGPHVLQSTNSIDTVEKFRFDLCSLANNHSMDYGQECLIETGKMLLEKGADSVGVGRTVEEACTPYIFEKEGLRIAFLCAAENSFGVIDEHNCYGHAWLFSKQLKRNIAQLRTCCDRIILLAHAGLEDLNYPMPEWVDNYRELIDLGVDVIIGSHPHVVQGWEKYNDGLIFYSLGDFLWQEAGSSFTPNKTIMVKIIIDGEVLSYEVIPVEIKENCIELNSDDASVKESLSAYCQTIDDSQRENLIKIVDEFCCAQYINDFSIYLPAACGCVIPRTLKQYIRSVYRSVFLKNRIDDAFVFHNCAVETNNYVCQRAIRLLNPNWKK